jgi:hypothetical protein
MKREGNAGRDLAKASSLSPFPTCSFHVFHPKRRSKNRFLTRKNPVLTCELSCHYDSPCGQNPSFRGNFHHREY